MRRPWLGNELCELRNWTAEWVGQSRLGGIGIGLGWEGQPRGGGGSATGRRLGHAGNP